jgi:hypothetical protein
MRRFANAAMVCESVRTAIRTSSSARPETPIMSEATEASLISLSGSFGEIFGGKTAWGFSWPRCVSFTNASNRLMRQCLLRRQCETSGGTFSRFWQPLSSVSFKGRFLGHLTTPCRIRRNFLAPKISPLLPGSDISPLQDPLDPVYCPCPLLHRLRPVACQVT